MKTKKSRQMDEIFYPVNYAVVLNVQVRDSREERAYDGRVLSLTPVPKNILRNPDEY